MLINHEEDFKYCMQDMERDYFGARYTYQELMQNELVPFKFKTIIERYLVRNIDRDTSLESHFYHMTRENPEYRVYRQLKARIRVTQLKSRKFRQEKEYTEKIYTLEQLTALSPEEKLEKEIAIREIILSKLALFAFAV